jgi:uncharacterized protein (TIGR03067 family)
MRVLTLTLCALAGLATEVACDEGAGRDGKALQGTWQAVSGEFSKEKITPREVEAIRLVIKEGTMTLEVGKEVLKSTYKLGPSKKPCAIDLTSTDGTTKGRTYLGIYELDGDSLKICFSEYDQERPGEFAAEGKPGIRTLLILERQKK